MTTDRFNRFCATLPHATHVVQWGGADVWKVGGKLFAIVWDAGTPAVRVTFKPTATGYEILSGQPGLRPAPYLASRGIKWIQRHSDASMSDEDLELYLKQSYDLVLAGLPKKTRMALGATTA